MKKPETIDQALFVAAELRVQADNLRREADELEQKWTGVATGQILSIDSLIALVRKIRDE